MNRMHRWRLVGGVLAIVVAVAAAAVLISLSDHNTAPQTQSGHPESAVPAQLLLTSSMRVQPVAGWKLVAHDLGLPAGTVMKPFGNVGDRGYFVGITDEGWWLVGIDVATGRRLFEPIRLGPSNDALAFNCFVNGPAMAICIRQDREPTQPALAWVIDTENGTVTFDGPTVLRISPLEHQPELQQIGDFVVATVSDEGVHGVGPHAELTWLVPGSGHLTQSTEWPRDIAPQALGVQNGSGSSTSSVVFSVADGSIVKPVVSQDQRLGRAVVFPGGFGYEVHSGDDSADRVAFFDDSGKLLSRPDLVGTLRIGALDLPMIETESTDTVVTIEGRHLLEIPKSTLTPYSRLIGSTLFVTTDERQRNWQQYDLRTGAGGKNCETEALGFSYIASDGAVAIAVGRRTPAEAYDLTTCDKLWSLPGSTQGQTKDVWKVNTTLIQRTNDVLSSLVAPSYNDFSVPTGAGRR
jgi:hypothetical protein